MTPFVEVRSVPAAWNQPVITTSDRSGDTRRSVDPLGCPVLPSNRLDHRTEPSDASSEIVRMSESSKYRRTPVTKTFEPSGLTAKTAASSNNSCEPIRVAQIRAPFVPSYAMTRIWLEDGPAALPAT